MILSAYNLMFWSSKMTSHDDQKQWISWIRSIVSSIVNTRSITSLVASRDIKQEKTLLPDDVRRSKTLLMCLSLLLSRFKLHCILVLDIIVITIQIFSFFRLFTWSEYSLYKLLAYWIFLQQHPNLQVGLKQGLCFHCTGYYGTVKKLPKRTHRVGRPAVLQSNVYRTLGEAQSVRFGEAPVLNGQRSQL